MPSQLAVVLPVVSRLLARTARRPSTVELASWLVIWVAAVLTAFCLLAIEPETSTTQIRSMGWRGCTVMRSHWVAVVSPYCATAEPLAMSSRRKLLASGMGLARVSRVRAPTTTLVKAERRMTSSLRRNGPFSVIRPSAAPVRRLVAVGSMAATRSLAALPTVSLPVSFHE